MRGLVIIGLVFINLFGVAATASAQTMSISQTVTIKGVVAPARYIIVDSQGIITSIISNSSEEVTPQVFLDRIVSGNERQLTPQINQQYKSILQTTPNQVGEIYKQVIPVHKVRIDTASAPKPFDQSAIIRSARLQLGRAWPPAGQGIVQPKYL